MANCLISEEEVAAAIKGLKIGKAAGPTGVVSEMMKAAGGFGSRWMTIHSLTNRAPPPTFNTSITTTPKDIANCFTKQFTNTVRHTSDTTHKINRATQKIQ